eukprot:CAMPEP_0172330550 /NCGR_PEP_ID=MMETSP1058-20130122/61457_1 /TAXON_ID=83371 /ORGANISM="Detonula confervacea, Strain CCMP 353" /LENGTH=1901 /DNA_ID=CAMNT_0013047765 /DNA_START=207 /DNA_END=5912 /DNA_ORIENTATION=+
MSSQPSISILGQFLNLSPSNTSPPTARAAGTAITPSAKTSSSLSKLRKLGATHQGVDNTMPSFKSSSTSNNNGASSGSSSNSTKPPLAPQHQHHHRPRQPSAGSGRQTTVRDFNSHPSQQQLEGNDGNVGNSNTQHKHDDDGGINSDKSNNNSSSIPPARGVELVAPQSTLRRNELLIPPWKHDDEVVVGDDDGDGENDLDESFQDHDNNGALALKMSHLKDALRSRGRTVKSSAGASIAGGTTAALLAAGSMSSRSGAVVSTPRVARRRSASMDQTKSDARVERATTNNKQENNPLPKGWKSTVDPNSYKVYYYHRKSGKVSWVRPQLSKEEEKSRQSALAAGLTTNTEKKLSKDKKLSVFANGSEAAAAAAAAVTKPGWKSTVDPNSNKVYYYNLKSGKVSWPTLSKEEEKSRQSGLAGLTTTEKKLSKDELSIFANESGGKAASSSAVASASASAAVTKPASSLKTTNRYSSQQNHQLSLGTNANLPSPSSIRHSRIAKQQRSLQSPPLQRVTFQEDVVEKQSKNNKGISGGEYRRQLPPLSRQKRRVSFQQRRQQQQRSSGAKRLVNRNNLSQPSTTASAVTAVAMTAAAGGCSSPILSLDMFTTSCASPTIEVPTTTGMRAPSSLLDAHDDDDEEESIILSSNELASNGKGGGVVNREDDTVGEHDSLLDDYLHEEEEEEEGSLDTSNVEIEYQKAASNNENSPTGVDGLFSFQGYDQLAMVESSYISEDDNEEEEADGECSNTSRSGNTTQGTTSGSIVDKLPLPSSSARKDDDDSSTASWEAFEIKYRPRTPRQTSPNPNKVVTSLSMEALHRMRSRAKQQFKKTQESAKQQLQKTQNSESMRQLKNSAQKAQEGAKQQLQKTQNGESMRQLKISAKLRLEQQQKVVAFHKNKRSKGGNGGGGVSPLTMGQMSLTRSASCSSLPAANRIANSASGVSGGLSNGVRNSANDRSRARRAADGPRVESIDDPFGASTAMPAAASPGNLGKKPTSCTTRGAKQEQQQQQVQVVHHQEEEEECKEKAAAGAGMPVAVYQRQQQQKQQLRRGASTESPTGVDDLFSQNEQASAPSSLKNASNIVDQQNHQQHEHLHGDEDFALLQSSKLQQCNVAELSTRKETRKKDVVTISVEDAMNDDHASDEETVNGLNVELELIEEEDKESEEDEDGDDNNSLESISLGSIIVQSRQQGASNEACATPMPSDDEVKGQMRQSVLDATVVHDHDENQSASDAALNNKSDVTTNDEGDKDQGKKDENEGGEQLFEGALLVPLPKIMRGIIDAINEDDEDDDIEDLSERSGSSKPHDDDSIEASDEEEQHLSSSSSPSSEAFEVTYRQRTSSAKKPPRLSRPHTSTSEAIQFLKTRARQRLALQHKQQPYEGTSISSDGDDSREHARPPIPKVYLEGGNNTRDDDDDSMSTIDVSMNLNTRARKRLPLQHKQQPYEGTSISSDGDDSREHARPPIPKVYLEGGNNTRDDDDDSMSTIDASMNSLLPPKKKKWFGNNSNDNHSEEEQEEEDINSMSAIYSQDEEKMFERKFCTITENVFPENFNNGATNEGGEDGGKSVTDESELTGNSVTPIDIHYLSRLEHLTLNGLKGKWKSGLAEINSNWNSKHSNKEAATHDCNYGNSVEAAYEDFGIERQLVPLNENGKKMSFAEMKMMQRSAKQPSPSLSRPFRVSNPIDVDEVSTSVTVKGGNDWENNAMADLVKLDNMKWLMNCGVCGDIDGEPYITCGTGANSNNSKSHDSEESEARLDRIDKINVDRFNIEKFLDVMDYALTGYDKACEMDDCQTEYDGKTVDDDCRTEYDGKTVDGYDDGDESAWHHGDLDDVESVWNDNRGEDDNGDNSQKTTYMPQKEVATNTDAIRMHQVVFVSPNANNPSSTIGLLREDVEPKT